MKANELRIGNYVTGKSRLLKDVTLTVTEINETHVQAWEKGPLGASDECLLPIPLTEEWLLKFGFIKMGGYAWYCRRIGRQRFIENHLTKGYFEVDNGSKRIQFVHQLQNLYFALTGEELIECNQ